MWSRAIHAAYYRAQHLLLAGNAHGLHSPFVYDLYTRAIRPNAKHANGPIIHLPEEEVRKLEAWRTKLLGNTDAIDVIDFGAGAGKVPGASFKRKVSQVAASTAKAQEWAEVLARITCFLQAERVLELGTCLGISTGYLALGQQLASKSIIESERSFLPTIVTLEGSPSLAALAREAVPSSSKVDIVIGNIDETLNQTLAQHFHPTEKPIDLAFLDANHTEEATYRYFEQLLPYCAEHTCLIFDDIHWSAGMHRAWQRIMAHPRVTQTIDLGQLGLVFFRNGVGQYRLR